MEILTQRDPFYDPEFRKKDPRLKKQDEDAARKEKDMKGLHDYFRTGMVEEVGPTQVEQAATASKEPKLIPLVNAKPRNGEPMGPPESALKDSYQSQNGIFSGINQRFKPEQTAQLLGDLKARGGTPLGLSDYVSGGSSLADIIGQKAQNAKIEAYNEGRIQQSEDDENRRQAAILEDLQLRGQQQALDIKGNQALREQDFFERTGLINSPQLMTELAKQKRSAQIDAEMMGRFDGITSGVKEAVARVTAGYPLDALPEPVRAEVEKIRRAGDQQLRELFGYSSLAKGNNADIGDIFPKQEGLIN